MLEAEEKIKDFLAEKTEKIAAKVEKTPMDKFFVFFLILITVAAVVLGFLQFNKDIQGPAFNSYLDLKRGELMAKYQALSLTTDETLANQLKNQDSDLDGLDDWSEINVYSTSPYLSDSDGDGISDKQEILKGTDPTCPEGVDCAAIVSSQPQVVNEITNLNSIIQNLGEADMQTIIQAEQDLLSSKTTLAQLGINNPELQNMFDQLRGSSASQSGNLNADAKNQIISNLQQLTPAQIRDELIKNGMDKATLDQIDDQTLQQMFQQIIDTYK